MITQNNQREKSNAGEYARVIHKLAQAYRQTGDVDRANKLNGEAKSIYQALIASGEYNRCADEMRSGTT